VPPERRFRDADSFFAEKLDAVSVTSPAPFHVDNVLAAAKAGAHVLCEKPLAEMKRTAGRWSKRWKRAGKHLLSAFIYRFSEMALRIRQAIREGEIGQVRSCGSFTSGTVTANSCAT